MFFSVSGGGRWIAAWRSYKGRSQCICRHYIFETEKYRKKECLMLWKRVCDPPPPPSPTPTSRFSCLLTTFYLHSFSYVLSGDSSRKKFAGPYTMYRVESWIPDQYGRNCRSGRPAPAESGQYGINSCPFPAASSHSHKQTTSLEGLKSN